MVHFVMEYSSFLALPTVVFITGILCHYIELASYYIKDKARGKGDIHYHYGIVPFLNPYAIAGVLLYIFVRDFRPINDLLFFVISFFFSGVIEVFAGVISEIILKKKLWSYSTVKYNILGYTTPFHMFKWALLSFLAIKIIYPNLLILVEKFDQQVIVTDIVFSVIMISTIILSFKKPLHSNYYAK